MLMTPIDCGNEGEIGLNGEGISKLKEAAKWSIDRGGNGNN